MKTQQSVPRLSESNLLRYLSQIFKVPAVTKCNNVYAAIEKLREVDDIYLPEGFDDTCVVLFDRTNVRGNLWSLREKSELAQMALEIGDDYCFLVPDVTMSGADSLFLCAMCASEGDSDMHSSLTALVDSWTQRGCPQITICGYSDKKHGGTVHIVAAQLKSLV